VATVLAASHARALGEARPRGAVAQERPRRGVPSSVHDLLRPGRGDHPRRGRLHRRGLRVLGLDYPHWDAVFPGRRGGACAST
jgi:hypothetical protein